MTLSSGEGRKISEDRHESTYSERAYDGNDVVTDKRNRKRNEHSELRFRQDNRPQRERIP
jgi:hypothetical protein